MSFLPHLQIQLAAMGFEDDANDLAKAETDEQGRAVIQGALHAVEGYQLALFRHARALQHTGARIEREQLCALEEALRARLELLSEPKGRVA